MAETRARGRMRSLMASSLGALVVLSVTSAAAKPLASGAATVEVARRPDAVVVVYRELLGEIGGTDRGPTVTVYGDGRVIAHYPVYMKRAGDWERRLAPSELDALVRSLAAKGVLDFDAPTVRVAARASLTASRARARATQQPIALFEASDASTTVIEMAVERYVSATPGAREARNVTKRAVWTGLRADAVQHPDVSALGNLAAAEQELRALRDLPGFARLP